MKKKWLIFSIIIIIGVFVVSLFTNSFGLGKIVEKSFRKKANVLAAETIDYINKNLLTGDTTATLVSSTWLDNGLVKFTLSLGGQQFDSYISSDGKFLFPEAIDLKKTEEKTAETGDNSASQEIPKRDVPQVKLFVMSFCPYGNQAEDVMNPVVELLGGKADISLNYIIYDQYAKAMGAKSEDYCLDKDEKYCSMHGRGELNQDVREMCVAKYQKDKLWPFVEEINKSADAQNVDTKWKAIAQNLKIDTKKIETCQKTEAVKLLEQEVVLNGKYAVQGSPTIVINDTIFQGGRTPEAYKQAICSAFTNPPSECQVSLGKGESTAQGSCQ